MKKTQLSEYLFTARSKSGLTQNDVAKALGYSTPQFISNWERGLSHPPLESLRKLASMYKISAEELFKVFLHSSLEQTEANLIKQFNKKARKKA
ncbi:MAG: helix-turn-helix domain-containing protein [Pseudobdellovibrionaceae bacterium]|jgi:transcriptional regulator with XRE-family HTH domain